MPYGKNIQIGTGFTRYSTTGTHNYSLNWHSFNPPLPSDLYSWTETAYPIADWAPYSSVDLTNFYPGHEVILWLVRIDWPYSWTIESRWKNPSGTTLFNYSSYISVADWYYSYVWSYIGVKNSQFGDHEINSNGVYYLETYIPWDWTYQNYFTTSGYDTARNTLHSWSEWYIWVEWWNICYISYFGTKHIIRTAGASAGTHWDPGMIWLPDASWARHMKFINASWEEWSTHLADNVGWNWYDGVWTTGHTPWYIWAEWWFQRDWLKFINYDWQMCRIGNGYLYGNAY